MLENCWKIITQLSIFKNQLWFHSQRNLILIITGGLILAPISFVVTKETANRYYSRINDREQLQVSEQVKQYADAYLPETSPDQQTSSGSSTAPTAKPKSSPTAGSSTSNKESASDSNQSNSSNNNSGSNNSRDSSDNQSSQNQSAASLPSCGSNYTFFSTSPLNQSDFNGIVPLGNVNPSGHTFPTDHVYFYFTNAQYNLYSPGNVTITQISASQNLTQGTSDYSIYFQPCSELKVYFLHVTSLSEKLSSQFSAPFGWDSTYTTGGNTYRNYGKNTSISISNGEQIGKVGGNPGQASFDMGAYDSRVTLNFANPSRWSQRDTSHTVCPLDYYSSAIKATLYNRLGDWDGTTKRTIAPICGTVEQDLAGIAQGVWFVKGTGNNWQSEDPHLALIHDKVNPNKALFSVGTSMSASNLHIGYYEFYPQSSGLVNRDFDDVRSDGNTYCYEMDGQGWVEGNITILVQLPTSTTLKIERGAASSCGSGPWSFTSSASEFER